MASANISFSVVIPCWNSETQMRQNLPAVLLAASQVSAEIVVVDDNSQQDNSRTFLKTLGTKIKLIQNSKNLGFAGAVNRGVSAARGEIVILLNTDVSPAKDCFTHIEKYFLDPHVFSVGLSSGEGSNRIIWERGLFHHFKQDYDPSQHGGIPTLWSSGGQGAFDKKKWQQLGGMDTLYKPFYWEDTDLGYRAWKSGWKNLFAPDCLCTHHHEKSVISNNFKDTKIYAVAQRNQFIFTWKNLSDFGMILNHLFYLPLYLYRYPKTLLAALKVIPQIIRSRRSSKKLWQVSDRDILKLWQY